MSTETTIAERFIAGATAGFLSQTTIYPLDVSRRQLDQRSQVALLLIAGVESASVLTPIQ